MKQIEQEYVLLFNAITDTVETLLRLQLQLMTAQQRAEELFLERTDSDLSKPA